MRIQRRRSGVGLVRADLEEPLGGVAEELELVDRLPGADLAQLGRAVGGQHEQRHARLVRLDRRRQQLGGGGARGAGDGDRQARSPWPARARRSRRSARRRASSSAGAARARASARAASSASRARCTRRACRSARARRRTRAAARRCRWRSVIVRRVTVRGWSEHVACGTRERGSRMAACRRRWSCCTASAAPATPGTRDRRGSTAERYRPLALDLPGHGELALAAAAPITFAALRRATCSRARPERFALCGYSLGGRVALHVALAAPERVARLVLVSTSAGHRGRGRARRAARGRRRLADELESVAFEEFIERWRAQPLFADEPAEVGALRARGPAPQRPARARRRAARARHRARWRRCGSGSAS